MQVNTIKDQRKSSFIIYINNPKHGLHSQGGCGGVSRGCKYCEEIVLNKNENFTQDRNTKNREE
jgi:hypothetical protein